MRKLSPQFPESPNTAERDIASYEVRDRDLDTACTQAKILRKHDFEHGEHPDKQHASTTYRGSRYCFGA